MSKQQEIQKQAFDNITNKYFDKKTILIYELGTGSGKSKILLDSAFEIMKKTGKSVIISTANNMLAMKMKEEALKLNSKCISNYDIEKIGILIGSSNYVDVNIIRSKEFLEEYNIQLEDVENWLANNINDGLTSQFIDFFRLNEDISEYISYSKEAVYNDDLQLLSTDFITNIEDILSKDYPRVYITNHFYLLTIYTLANKINKEIYTVTLLIDEVHTLAEAGALFFSNSFSIFRIKYLLSDLLSLNVLNKKDINNVQTLLRYIVSVFSSLDTQEKFVKNSQHLAELFSKYKIMNILKSILTKDKKITVIKKLIREISEMYITLNSNNKNSRLSLEVSYSPIKQFPSCKIVNENPTQSLRTKFFAKNGGFLCGVSGTIRTSESKRIADNKWSFERIGLYQFFENKEKYELDDFMQNWNLRLNTNLVFFANESIFLKNQACYKIFTEERFQYPRYAKERKINDRIELETNWIKNISSALDKILYGNTLILMTSNTNCEIMFDVLNQSEALNSYSKFYAKEDVPFYSIQNQYKRTIEQGGKAILISNLTGYVGLDLPGELIETIVITKLPFEPNPNMFMKNAKITSFSSTENNRLKAVMTFRQGLGRGLRNENDKVFFVIFDERIKHQRNKEFMYFLNNMAFDYDTL